MTNPINLTLSLTEILRGNDLPSPAETLEQEGDEALLSEDWSKAIAAYEQCGEPPADAAVMCAATPMLIAPVPLSSAPDVGFAQWGCAQRWPACFASRSLEARLNSSLMVDPRRTGRLEARAGMQRTHGH